MLNYITTLLKLIRWKSATWLPGYAFQQLSKPSRRKGSYGQTHVIVSFVDHFEPSRKEGPAGVLKMKDWCDRYESVASRFLDSDGIYPQHSWFYRYDYPNFECIKILSQYVYKDLGEIEFHLHHGNDTPDSFDRTIKDGLQWFNQCGAQISAEAVPKKRFAYIAGNWALDNGRRDASLSGVNTEIDILRKNGCYADYTFPAFGTNAQPIMVNTVYYAKDTEKPKSYSKGIPLKVGRRESGDLMIYMGPMYIDWKSKYIEYAAVEHFAPYFNKRIKYWLSADVHVQGRPEWIFIKLHTHGMQSHEFFFSEKFEEMFVDLGTQLKTFPYALHYVTAREAYNIAKAAEDNKSGNPNDYRNYLIKPPVNRKIFCNQPYELVTYGAGKIELKVGQDTAYQEVYIKLKDCVVEEILAEKIFSICIKQENNVLKELFIDGKGYCQLKMKRGALSDDVILPEKIRLPFSLKDKNL